MCFSKGGILWRFVIKICLIKGSTEVIRTQKFLQDPRIYCFCNNCCVCVCLSVCLSVNFFPSKISQELHQGFDKHWV